MTGLLFVGLFLGLAHATEADHIAAVATMATQAKGVRAAVRTGLLWGFGHMTTLFLVGGVVLIVGTAIPDHVAAILESIVGLMLIVLGVDVLWRARKALAPRAAPAIKRVLAVTGAPKSETTHTAQTAQTHVHWHTHGLMLGHGHAHAHSHPEDVMHAHAHAPGPDSQAGPRERRRWRPFFVGLVHGMAGSAALVLLAAGSAHSPELGLAYIAIFGFGSMLGMGLVSLAMALPLHYASRRLPRLTALIGLVTGIVSIALGVYALVNELPVALG